MKGFFVILLTSLFLSWITARARTAKARKVGQNWVFAPVGAVEAVFSLGVAMGAVFVFFGARGPQADRTLVVSGGILFILGSGLTWPKAIRLSESGLRQHTWYGGWKEILWPEVSSVYKKRDSSIVVRGKQGKIVFSSSHAGRELFTTELRERLPRLTHNTPSSDVPSL
jgi:hypothetical protein